MNQGFGENNHDAYDERGGKWQVTSYTRRIEFVFCFYTNRIFLAGSTASTVRLQNWFEGWRETTQGTFEKFTTETNSKHGVEGRRVVWLEVQEGTMGPRTPSVSGTRIIEGWTRHSTDGTIPHVTIS